MAFTPKFIPNDNLDEEPLEDIRVAVVIPEIEEILDERKFVLLMCVYCTLFHRFGSVAYRFVSGVCCLICVLLFVGW